MNQVQTTHVAPHGYRGLGAYGEATRRQVRKEVMRVNDQNGMRFDLKGLRALAKSLVRTARPNSYSSKLLAELVKHVKDGGAEEVTIRPQGLDVLAASLHLTAGSTGKQRELLNLIRAWQRRALIETNGEDSDEESDE